MINSLYNSKSNTVSIKQKNQCRRIKFADLLLLCTCIHKYFFKTLSNFFGPLYINVPMSKLITEIHLNILCEILIVKIHPKMYVKV